MTRIVLEQDRCVASGQCVLAAPEVFDQRDDDGIAVLLGDNPPPELDDAVQLAAATCPALAIIVTQE